MRAVHEWMPSTNEVTNARILGRPRMEARMHECEFYSFIRVVFVDGSSRSSIISKDN